MPLTLEEVKEVLKGSKGSKNSVLAKAIRHEDRLRLHSETILDDLDVSRVITQYIDGFVKLLLPPDKFRMFKVLFRFPVSTVALTDRIFTTLGKVFDGRNPVFSYEFRNPEDRQDWEAYRTQVLKEPRFWRTTAFEVFKTAINSIMVVDLPREQSGPIPDPYLYFLNLSRVISFKLGDDNVLEWVAFETSDGSSVAVFDDETYRVFSKKSIGSHTDVDFSNFLEGAHGLGYCPARFFWSTSISNRYPAIKKSPLSNFLGQLDMLLFLEGGNDHLNLYARWPVTWSFAADCDFENPDNGDYCDGGFVRKSNDDYAVKDGELVACPRCVTKKLNGPGSEVEIDPPTEDNNVDLRNPVGHVKIPRDSLDYNNEDLEARRNRIYSAITGDKGDPINDQAVNEKQVGAMFESREAAIKKTQTNFEQAMTWAAETICRLRYPDGSFVRASISLGTDHFILSPDELRSKYKEEKENGASLSVLDTIEDQYFESEYRNNPEMLLRTRIIANLDPFRHRTLEEARSLYDAGFVRLEDLMIKANLSTLIARFERENVTLSEFGSALNFSQRIDRIKTALESYVQKMQPDPESGEEGNNGEGDSGAANNLPPTAEGDDGDNV